MGGVQVPISRSALVISIFTFMFLILTPEPRAAFAEAKHPPDATIVSACGEADASTADAKNKAIADALRNAVLSEIGAYVASTTIGSNYQIVRDEILLKASGFATLESVESTSITDGILRVKIKAAISNRPLVEKLKQLGLTHEWKVGVYMPETYGGRPASELAAEASIIQRLMDAGFRVIDKPHDAQDEAKHSGAGAKTGYYLLYPIHHSDATRRASEGDADSLSRIKREYDVDILITGRASAEYVDQNDDSGTRLYRTKGKIEARAYYTGTGEVMCVTDASADGLDQTEDLSAERCFKCLGSEAGRTLAQDILVAPASMSRCVTVKIRGIQNVCAANDLEKAVSGLPGVSRVTRDYYNDGIMELSVDIKAEYRDELPANIESSDAGRKLRIKIDASSKMYVQGRARL